MVSWEVMGGMERKKEKYPCKLAWPFGDPGGKFKPRALAGCAGAKSQRCFFGEARDGRDLWERGLCAAPHLSNWVARALGEFCP